MCISPLQGIAGRPRQVCSLDVRNLTQISTSRVVPDLPVKADLYLRYLPSATTLFRFSALTFNGHYIHLDREYAQTSEGYPGGQNACAVLDHSSATHSQRGSCTGH